MKFGDVLDSLGTRNTASEKQKQYAFPLRRVQVYKVHQLATSRNPQIPLGF